MSSIANLVNQSSRDWREAQKLTGCDSCQKRSLMFDIYRRPFLLYLPDNETQYRSFAGSMLSVFTILLVLSYACW